MSSLPLIVAQYRNASRSSTVCTTVPLQALVLVKLARNAGIVAMLRGMHSSMDEKYLDPEPHASAIRVPGKIIKHRFPDELQKLIHVILSSKCNAITVKQKRNLK